MTAPSAHRARQPPKFDEAVFLGGNECMACKTLQPRLIDNVPEARADGRAQPSTVLWRIAMQNESKKQTALLFLIPLFVFACGRREDRSTETTSSVTDTAETIATDTSTSGVEVPTGGSMSATSTSGSTAVFETTTSEPDNPVCQLWVDWLIMCEPRIENPDDYRDGCNQEISEGLMAGGPMCAKAIEAYYACQPTAPCEFQDPPWCVTESNKILEVC